MISEPERTPVDPPSTAAVLLDSSDAAIYRQELDHTISSWNTAAEELYGWRAADVIGASARRRLFADVARFDEILAQTLRAGTWSGEADQLTADGATIPVECRWTLVRDEGGERAFAVHVLPSSVESERMVERRYRAQRMESLGTLAGGIAHDLNNVLAPILISAQLLAVDEEDQARRQLLAHIETSVQRAADMTRRVLTFARGDEQARRLVDAGAVVEQLDAFCRNTLPKSIELVVRQDDGLWPVLADATQLMQVLMNLVTNARDAMPNGGVLTIGARNRRGLLDETTSETTDYVVVEVEDDGSGMDAETLSNIFEPFFTTKPLDEGTGLGLSTSLAIVRSHGGDLEVYSEPGNGTRFGLTLPRAGDESMTATDEDDTVSLALLHGQGELILVVDDDDAIRTIVQRALAAHGYRTVQAGGVAEAIALFHRNPAVDLILTDMMMPGIDGAALLHYFYDHHPAVPVVVSSGLTANAEAARRAHSGAGHFLLKPFSMRELLRACRGALTASPVTRDRGAASVRAPRASADEAHGMARLAYGGATFVTTDEVGDALLSVATALARSHSAEAIHVPVVDDDGGSTTISMVVGPSSELLSMPLPEERTEVAGVDAFLADTDRTIADLEPS